MSLDDLFGPHPGRPEHPDMETVSAVVRDMDRRAEQPGYDFEADMGSYIDPTVLTYVAMMRGRICMTRIGVEIPGLILVISGVWLDGFLAGAEYQRRYST